MNDGKKVLISTILAVLLVMFTAGAVSFLTGCQSAPKKENYAQDECFMQADCMYRNEKNPDKSACAQNAEECTAAQKEKRAYERIKFCKDPKTRPEGMSESECRLWLNQK